MTRPVETAHRDGVDEDETRGRLGRVAHYVDQRGARRVRARSRASLDGHPLARLAQVSRRERTDRQTEERRADSRGAPAPQHGEERTERRADTTPRLVAALSQPRLLARSLS